MISIALYHFHVDQIKRSAGQSVVASAAYRASEKLHSVYYCEDSDYTNKGGVIYTEIFLPPHAPREYADRETLWNAVEKVEKGKKAQLAYSFDIAFQNEFSQEENIALARQFLTEHFVSRGMVVDFAVHEPEKEEGGINNPHFHFLCPIRPMEQKGKWGLKQRREYVLDENGNRIPDGKGDYVFNAVPTTDWGSAETLEFWREQWAVMCNAKFEEKGLDVRIDHRSYERQGVELLPTRHEGPTVRAMEKKGIKTEKGEFNRWINATNAFIRNLRKNLSLLLETIQEIKAEMDKPQSAPVIIPLQRYFDMRNAKAYSQKARVSNLKELSDMANYLKANEIYTIEDLESRLSTLKDTVDELKCTMDKEFARMKEIRKVPEYLSTIRELKPIVDGLQKIKFDKAKAKYKAEHEKELKQYYAVRRKFLELCPDNNYDQKLLDKEYAALEKAHAETYAKFKAIREEYQQIWHIQSCVNKGLGNTEQTHQKKDNRKQDER